MELREQIDILWVFRKKTEEEIKQIFMFNEFYELFFDPAGGNQNKLLGAPFIKKLSSAIGKFKMIPDDFLELSFVYTMVSSGKTKEQEALNKRNGILKFMFENGYMQKLPSEYEKIVSVFQGKQQIMNKEKFFKKKVIDLFNAHENDFLKCRSIYSLYNSKNVKDAAEKYNFLIIGQKLQFFGISPIAFENGELSGYMINYLFDRFCKNKSGCIPLEQNEIQIENIQQLRRDGIVNELNAMLLNTEEYMDILKIALVAIADNDDVLFQSSLGSLKSLFIYGKLQFNHTKEEYSKMLEYILGNIPSNSQEFLQISQFVLTTGFCPISKDFLMFVVQRLNFELPLILVETLFNGLFNNNDSLKFDLFNNKNLSFLEKLIEMKGISDDMMVDIYSFIKEALKFRFQELKFSNNSIKQQLLYFLSEKEEASKQQMIGLIQEEIKSCEKQIENNESEICLISQTLKGLSENTVEEIQIDNCSSSNSRLNQIIKILFVCKNKMNKFEEVNQFGFVQQAQVLEQEPFQLHQEEFQEVDQCCTQLKKVDEEFVDDQFQEVSQFKFAQQIHVSNKVPCEFQQILQQNVEIQQMPEHMVKQYGRCNCQQNFVIKQEQGKKERSSEESSHDFM